MTKKNTGPSPRAEALLRQWLGDNANPSAADLTALVGRETAVDIAIIGRLAGLADGASAAALRTLEQSGADKEVRKEARRALYKLGQRGVALPAAAPSAPAPLSLAPTLEAYLSPVDGNGDQLVWLVKARPSGLSHLYAVVNDPEGLREVELVETTRKDFRAARQSLFERNEIEMIEADVAYCDFLIDRGVRWARQGDRRFHGDYGRLRGSLLATPPRELPPPIYSHLNPDEIRADIGLRQQSPAILGEKEMRTWFLGIDVLVPYLEEAKKAESSPILLPEAQQEERSRRFAEKALRELFGGERQASWVRRLEMMSFFFLTTRRPTAARQALAAALSLAESKDGGNGVLFCEVLLGSSVRAWQHLAAEREAEKAGSQLVVTPQQAARQGLGPYKP